MPDTAGKINEQLGIEKTFSSKDLIWGSLKEGTKTKRGDILFKKISKQ
jgi:methionyl-tRNA synthetase